MIGFTWTAYRLAEHAAGWRQTSMPPASVTIAPPQSCSRFHPMLLLGLIFIGLTLCLCFFGIDLPLAIYALSFWHYYLYWLAYYFGAVPLAEFKRDALVMKSAALAALACVYLSAPLDPLSLAVVASGFLLNAWAASVLGVDRTYYGYEVANLPPQRITRLPYAWISHPMIVGNVLAYGGTLVNAEFRQAWWPLAAIHVGLNLGLLAMEMFVTPQRRSANPLTRCEERYDSLAADVFIVAIAAQFAGAAAFFQSSGPNVSLAVGILASVYALAMFRVYSAPMPLSELGVARPEEDCP